jgi:hypothetical protein
MPGMWVITGLFGVCGWIGSGVLTTCGVFGTRTRGSGTRCRMIGFAPSY